MTQFVFSGIRSASSSANRHSVVLFATTGFRCWLCESSLGPGFCGVHGVQNTRLGRRRFLFVVCGQTCQRGVVKEVEEYGIPAQQWTGQQVRTLLEDEDSIAGILEAISVEGLCRLCGTAAREQ